MVMNRLMKNILYIGFFLALQIFTFEYIGIENFQKNNTNECSIVPINNFRFPILSFGQMSENTFNKIVHILKDVYTPLVKKQLHQDFILVADWQNDEANAFARVERQDPEDENSALIRVVKLYGGLARHPLMTPEAFLTVACHEVGHHLAGAPEVDFMNESKISAEGQSDYFATSKCLRRIYRKMGDSKKWLIHSAVPLVVRTKCQFHFFDEEDSAICMRSAMASFDLAQVLASLQEEDPKTLSFNKKDPNITPVMNLYHPFVQCRLDTFFNGALCPVKESINFSRSDLKTGACNTEQALYAHAARPQCWFIPESTHLEISAGATPAIVY